MDGWQFCDPFRCGIDWLNTWQTLFGGILAIAAAAFAIGQTERHESRRRQSRHAAARATLPLTLSGICDYATSVAGHLRTVLMFHHAGAEIAIEDEQRNA